MAQTRKALHPHRRPRGRAHGHGRARCGGLGRNGNCSWCSARAIPGRRLEAYKLLAGGFRAIKLRLGYPTAVQDLTAVRAVRRRIGDAIDLMVDYNQALSIAEALRRGRMLDEENS